MLDTIPALSTTARGGVWQFVLITRLVAWLGVLSLHCWLAPCTRAPAAGEDEEMEEGDSEEEDGMGGGGGGEPVVMEQAILTVCEITGLPRHTAIELLLVHGGDASAVLAHVFP